MLAMQKVQQICVCANLGLFFHAHLIHTAHPAADLNERIPIISIYFELTQARILNSTFQISIFLQSHVKIKSQK